VQAIAGRLHLQGVQLHKHVTAHTALQQAGRQRQHVSSSLHCLPPCYVWFLKFAVLLPLTLLNDCHCLCVWWWLWFCRSCPSRPQADHQEGHVCRSGPLHSRRDKAPPAYKPSPAIAGFHSQGGEEHQRPLSTIVPAASLAWQLVWYTTAACYILLNDRWVLPNNMC